jgi:hypothetical protein
MGKKRRRERKEEKEDKINICLKHQVKIKLSIPVSILVKSVNLSLNS